MNKKFKSFLQFAIFFGLGVFLVWYSLKDLTEADKDDIMYALSNADYSWLVLSLVLAISSHVSRAIRWRILLEPMGYRPTIANAFFAVMVGYLANLAFPRLGEVSRCGVLYKYEGIPIQKSLGTVVVERAIDMLCLGIVLLAALAFHYDLLTEHLNAVVEGVLGKSMLLGTAGVVGVLGLITLYILRHRIKKLSFYEKVAMFVKGLLEGLKSIGNLKSPWAFLFHSVFIWVMYLLMIYLCFFCFEDTANLGIGAGVSALAFGSFGMIATQGGLGAYPLIIEGIMVLFGVSANMGKALGWLVWTAQTVMMLVFGVLSLSLLPVFNKKVNEMPEDAAPQDV